MNEDFDRTCFACSDMHDDYDVAKALGAVLKAYDAEKYWSGEKKDTLLRDKVYMMGYDQGKLGGKCLPPEGGWELHYADDYVMGWNDGQGDLIGH